MQEHGVLLLEFYEWMRRYLTPSQEEVHKLLAIVATSVTELTPPDTALVLVHHIARTFIHDKVK
jgi:protein SDA1